MADAILTAERLRELVSYDAESGVFTRIKTDRRNTRYLGPIPHNPCGNGYAYIGVEGKRYPAHRLAWLYVQGRWPDDDIDHINGNRTDNRLSNLRAVSREVNNQNRRKTRSNNKCGLMGVSWHTHSRCWRARIMIRGKEIPLGHFDSKEQAYAAYLDAKRSLHAGCTI